MVKKSKGKHRLDKYYHLAKEQGFRSRAAFKLIQLNRKYGFLQNCKALLDLCAAPGGWMQVAAKNMPLSSLILGVDLAPIKPIRGTRSYISDITTAQCRQLLKKEAAGSLFDVVLHDGAPNVGGAWSSEAYTQSVLVADALALAVEFLAPGGTFVTKVFRSKDYNALLYAFGQLFKKVEATKPQASRNASAEIFVVCLGYKAPAKVDPRLLDPKHLFQEVAEAPKIMGPEALLKQKIKQTRHRGGYDDGLSSSHKVASAVSFVLSGNAVEMLGQVTKFALEGKAAEQTEAAEGEEQQVDAQQLAAAIRSHPSTDGEIKELCSDLQVLGRSEFKQLLRWRLGLRRDLKSLLGGGAAAEEDAKKGSHKKQQQQQQDGEGDEEEGGEQEDAETKLLAEMEAIKDAAEKRVRKEKRKRREVKKKAKVRTAQLLAAEGGEDNSGAPDDEQLFGLGVLDAAAAGIAADKGGSSKAAAAAAAAASVLKNVSSAAAPGEREMELLEQPDEDEQWSDDDSDASSMDSDDAALQYEAELEEQLDNAYASYLERKGVRDAAAKEKRQRLGKGGELAEDEDGDAAGAAADAADAADSESDDPEEYGARLQQEAEDASEDEAAAAAGAGGGLLVQLDTSRAGVAKGGAAAAAQWFGQDLFEDPNVEVSSDEEDKQQQQQQQRQRIQLKRQKQQAPESAAAEDTEQQQQQSSKRHKTGANANGVANGSSGGYDSGNSSGEDRGSDSEIGASDSEAELDSDEEEFNALDDYAKAEVMALAKKMLRRKDKDSIVEAAYNRYAFHDDKLPRWFAEDESRHMRPLPQVTKEDIEAEKARLAAIDARPIKKVAQAKQRKQKRLQVRLDAARAKATTIAAQDDVPMSSKMREIEKLYSKAKAGKGAKGKGKGGKAGGRKGKGPPLDGRMRKDKRGLDKAAARKKGPKGKGGVRKKGGRR